MMNHKVTMIVHGSALRRLLWDKTSDSYIESRSEECNSEFAKDLADVTDNTRHEAKFIMRLEP